MDRKSDIVMASVFVAVGIGILGYAMWYPEPKVHFDDIGPMGFPIVLALLFIIGGIWQTRRDLVVLRTVGRFGINEGKEDDEPDLPASFIQAAKIMAGSLVYLALIPVLGYLIATPLAVGAGLLTMETSLRRTIAVSIVFTAIGFFLFYVFLGIPLPTGPLYELFATGRT